MTRAPRSEYWVEKVLPASMTVHTEEIEPVATGLVDHRGHPIYRVPEPIGFRFARPEKAERG